LCNSDILWSLLPATREGRVGGGERTVHEFAILDQHRHCERSEAIHLSFFLSVELWIVSLRSQ
jgi:hypothetical protein